MMYGDALVRGALHDDVRKAARVLQAMVREDAFARGRIATDTLCVNTHYVNA